MKTFDIGDPLMLDGDRQCEYAGSAGGGDHLVIKVAGMDGKLGVSGTRLRHVNGPKQKWAEAVARGETGDPFPKWLAEQEPQSDGGDGGGGQGDGDGETVEGPPAWEASTEYAIGDQVAVVALAAEDDTADTEVVQVYECVGAGTSGGFGPQGTEAPIEDGGCFWKLAEPAAAEAPAEAPETSHTTEEAPTEEPTAEQS